MPGSGPMGALPLRDPRAGGSREDGPRQDPLFLGFAQSGELLVARVRILLLSVVFLHQVVPGADVETQRVAVPLILAALCLALVFHLLASRGSSSWLGFVSSSIDVTLVSSGLAAFLLLDRPLMAVNSRAIFELYFLAIGCAGFRASWRVCAFTGGLAVFEYAAIVNYAALAWDLGATRFASSRLGVFDWGIQGARLFLLAAAGCLSTLIAIRARYLHELGALDPASGAATVRTFLERVEDEGSRARRYARPLAVAVARIDQLGAIAQGEGQAVADQVLRAVTGVVHRSIRRSDLVARTGPDELSLLMPETTAELVVGKLERLRRTVAGTVIATGRRPKATATVTLSIGVASWPDDGAQMDAVLGRAAARLTEARASGPNITVGPPRGRPVLSDGAPPASGV